MHRTRPGGLNGGEMYRTRPGSGILLLLSLHFGSRLLASVCGCGKFLKDFSTLQHSILRASSAFQHRID